MKFKLNKSDYLIYAIVAAIVLVVFFVLPRGLTEKEDLSLTKDQSQIEQTSEYDNPTESSDEISEDAKPSRGISMTQWILNIISLGILVFFVFLLFKRSKGEDLAFVFIWIRKNKKTKKRFLQVTIYNLGKYSLGINAPVLEFFHKNDVKRYTITKVENQVIYPLTIPIKQGHRLNINFEKFYLNVVELKNYKTMRISYKSLRGKVFKSNKVGV